MYDIYLCIVYLLTVVVLYCVVLKSWRLDDWIYHMSPYVEDREISQPNDRNQDEIKLKIKNLQDKLCVSM